MHESAVPLGGLHVRVFQHKNRPVGVDLPGGAQRRLEHGQTAAEDNTFGFARRERFAAKIEGPIATEIGDCVQKGVVVEAAQVVRAVIETGRKHRAVERHPVALLPEKRLESGDVAIANDAFGRSEIFRAERVEKISGTVTATQRDESIKLRITHGAENSLETLLGGRSEVS